MLVRRYIQTPGFETVVIGGKQGVPPFPGIDFRAVSPAFWPLGNTNLRYAAAVAEVLRNLRPAMVEVHNRPEMALALAARLPAIPVVGFLHNDPLGMREATTAAERRELLRRLACVVTPSDWLRTRLLDGIADPPKPPVVLPNCLDLTEIPPPVRRERLVLFAGRVVADKAPDAFISAYAAASPYLNGWLAEIIGADRFSPDSPDTPFLQTIRGAASGAGVRMLGYRDHSEVLATMNRAAIVVMPSRWPEPFGLVALEAMACGAALICSPRGALPEVAGDAALYADPDNVPDIAAAIRLLGTNESRRMALASQGRLRARQFDITVVAEQLAALRHRVLGG